MNGLPMPVVAGLCLAVIMVGVASLTGKLETFLAFPFKSADWVIRKTIRGAIHLAYAFLAFALALDETYAFFKAACARNYRRVSIGVDTGPSTGLGVTAV